MKVYEQTIIPELNSEIYYKIGYESVNLALDIAKKMNDSYNEDTNFFIYWIGNNITYKHSVVLKSFLATQNLSKCKLFIYSDVDISKNDFFKDYINNVNIEFRIFDVHEESKGTPLENFKHNDNIKLHRPNPALESDFFRILMLYKYGGVYIDFDVLFLRDLAPLLQYEFMYQWGSEDNRINGAIMHIKKESKLSKDLIKEILTKDVSYFKGSLSWADELYCKVREYNKDWIVFPGAFFNPEWQHTVVCNFFKDINNINLYDGSFAWHWHNNYNEIIEPNSKFDILDKIFTSKLK